MRHEDDMAVGANHRTAGMGVGQRLRILAHNRLTGEDRVVLDTGNVVTTTHIADLITNTGASTAHLESGATGPTADFNSGTKVFSDGSGAAQGNNARKYTWTDLTSATYTVTTFEIKTPGPVVVYATGSFGSKTKETFEDWTVEWTLTFSSSSGSYDFFDGEAGKGLAHLLLLQWDSSEGEHLDSSTRCYIYDWTDGVPPVYDLLTGGEDTVITPPNPGGSIIVMNFQYVSGDANGPWDRRRITTGVRSEDAGSGIDICESYLSISPSTKSSGQTWDYTVNITITDVI